MAAGGGTFITENKVLPGAYINFISKARALGGLGERGIVAMPYSGSWGPTGEIFEVSLEDFQKNSLRLLGYSYDSDRLLTLREVFKGASLVKLYRTNGGKKAKTTITSDSLSLTVTALYEGTRGNDIQIIIENDIDSENGFIVRTIIGEEMTEIDLQKVTDAGELIENAFVSFSGSGVLPLTAGSRLSGGEDAATSGSAYSEFLDKVEATEFNALLYDGSDLVTKGLFASFIKRLRDDEGYKVTCVLHDYSGADFEGIISVKNLCKNTGLERALIYWVCGQTAGGAVNESLTNKEYDGELSVITDFKKSELKEAIQNGEFTFYADKGSVKVLKDINSFTSFSSEKNSDFANNQVIRVLDAVGNDTAEIFDKYYLGKLQNNDVGRDIFKTELVKYHLKLQAIGAITNFTAEDIIVEKGTEKGDVIVKEYIEPVGAMDKLYMTCVVE